MAIRQASMAAVILLTGCVTTTHREPEIPAPTATPEVQTKANGSEQNAQPAESSDAGTAATHQTSSLRAEDQAWINRHCRADVLGPALWKSCIERSLAALRSGMPDLGELNTANREWIEHDCPADVMGPALWKSCAERSLTALRSGMPDLGELNTADREWIERDCPADVMGPALWKSCVERNLSALRQKVNYIQEPTQPVVSTSTKSAAGSLGERLAEQMRGVGERLAEQMGEAQDSAAERTANIARLEAEAELRAEMKREAEAKAAERAAEDRAPHLPKPPNNERWLCGSRDSWFWFR